jgi:predicted RNA-binding protein with PUA-like domain
MAHWLLKSEPSSWSWSDQVKAGAKGTEWNGVRNHLAKKHLMAMKKGERAFFYHSGEEKSVVGIVEIAGEYRPDPTDKIGKFGLVDVRAVAPLKTPVTLEENENMDCHRVATGLSAASRIAAAARDE